MIYTISQTISGFASANFMHLKTHCTVFKFQSALHRIVGQKSNLMHCSVYCCLKVTINAFTHLDICINSSFYPFGPFIDINRFSHLKQTSKTFAIKLYILYNNKYFDIDRASGSIKWDLWSPLSCCYQQPSLE